MDIQYDVIIIGAGPAGLTAGVYGSRGGLKVAMLEKDAPGGKMIKTDLIENYPGVDNVLGADLSMKMFDHATAYGTEYLYGDVTEIKQVDGTHVVVTEDGSEYSAHAVIVATGTNERTFGFPEDDALLGKGLSYCAVCDGAFFKDKNVVVVGGGNSALEESLYLTQFASGIDLVIRRDQFRGDDIYQKQVIANPKINIIKNYKPKAYVIDDNHLSGLEFESTVGEEDIVVKADGAFPYIGAIPATQFLQGLNVLNDEGYVIVNDKLETGIPGLYAAGDVIEKHLRQIVTAASDGAIAAQNAFTYIQTRKSDV